MTRLSDAPTSGAKPSMAGSTPFTAFLLRRVPRPRAHGLRPAAVINEDGCGVAWASGPTDIATWRSSATCSKAPSRTRTRWANGSVIRPGRRAAHGARAPACGTANSMPSGPGARALPPDLDRARPTRHRAQLRGEAFRRRLEARPVAAHRLARCARRIGPRPPGRGCVRGPASSPATGSSASSTRSAAPMSTSVRGDVRANGQSLASGDALKLEARRSSPWTRPARRSPPVRPALKGAFDEHVANRINPPIHSAISPSVADAAALVGRILLAVLFSSPGGARSAASSRPPR
jgi:hypothetical protein